MVTSDFGEIITQLEKQRSAIDTTLVALRGLDGVGAPRRSPGQRSGAWRKMRVNRGREFVIGGYTVAGTTFDALIFGYYGDQGRI